MSSFDSNCPDFHQKQLRKLCYPILLERLTLQSQFFAILHCKVNEFLRGCQYSISPSVLIPCFLRSSNRALSDIPRSFAAPRHVLARLNALSILSFSAFELRCVRSSALSRRASSNRRSLTVITSPLTWKAAKRTTSFSSRILPGHGCSFRALIAEASSRFFGC